MTGSFVRIAVALVTLVTVVPASAALPTPVAISVSPSRLVLDGATQTVVAVTNSGTTRTAIDVTVGNYVIAADGSVAVDPKLPPGRSAKRWLRVVPSRVDLTPGQSAQMMVTSRPARSAQPGDHHALLLFSTVPKTSRGVAVRTRVGVTALVRVGGPLVRRLRPLGLGVAGRGPVRLVRLRVSNLGNVNERFVAGRTLLELRRNGELIARARATTRSILPGTIGYLVFRYRAKLAGPARALVRVRPTPAAQAGPGIAATPPTIVVRGRVRL